MEAGAIAAKRAGLRYVAPAESGYARRTRGKGFILVARQGTRVTDQDTLDRFSHLAIPPAWRDVWVCRDGDGHLQATGYDARDRKQYLYHAGWAARRNQTKFHRVIDFAKSLPAMRKSGKHHDIEITDPRAARIVKRCQELPGHDLFSFLDDAGAAHHITSSDVNTYLAASCCGEFTAKDFRTWGGTVRAFDLLRAGERTGVKRTDERLVVRIIREVAEHLGNTPAMSRRYYIHPAVLSGFLDGKLGRAILPRRARSGLSLAETQALAFLERRA